MTAPTSEPGPWLTATEAASLLGVPRSTVHSYVRAKRIPFARLSPRVIRFDREELLAWLEARRVRTP